MLGGKKKKKVSVIKPQVIVIKQKLQPIIGVYWTASYWLEMPEMSGECYQLCVCMAIDLIKPSTQRLKHSDRVCKKKSVSFHLQPVEWVN